MRDGAGIRRPLFGLSGVFSSIKKPNRLDKPDGPDRPEPPPAVSHVSRAIQRTHRVIPQPVSLNHRRSRHSHDPIHMPNPT